MIERVSATEVLANCRRKLGIPNDQEAALDDATLAGLGRRSAGIHCPCSQATLRASLLECTRGLLVAHESLPEAIDETIESLIVGGDLLELRDVATEDPNARQTWVFAASPRFVVRPSGSVFLFGVVPDQDSFLPSRFSDRVLHRGATRLLEPRPGENLPDELSELGLQELSDRAWLRSPQPEDPASLKARHAEILARQNPVTEVLDLQILDSARRVTYYRGRWTEPTNQDGMFVARRPQEFGAAIWCLVDLHNGSPVRLLDLPLKQTRWRACDAAWHLQMAIDHCNGEPQRYRRRAHDGGARFDFFSPLPQWSQRRLLILGRPVTRDRSLISYTLPANEADTEEAFLQQNLWLSPVDSHH